MKIKDVLVPVDFSPASLKAVEFAYSMLGPEGEMCLLHVIDSNFISQLGEEGLMETEAAIEKMRGSAEAKLAEIARRLDGDQPQIDTMVVVGIPFAEILRVANDLFFEMIVLSIRGRNQGSIEGLLFGSTAEKVLRAARVPVVCLPMG